MIEKYVGSNEKKTYGYETVSIEEFIYEVGVENIIHGFTTSVYESYVEYCESFDCLPCSQNLLSSYLRKNHNIGTTVRKVNGKSYRVYVKK